MGPYPTQNHLGWWQSQVWPSSYQASRCGGFFLQLEEENHGLQLNKSWRGSLFQAPTMAAHGAAVVSLPVPYLCVPHGQGFWPCSRTAFPAFPVTGLCWQHWAQAVPAGSSSAQGAGIPPSPLLKGWGKNEVLLPSVVSGPSAGFTPCLSVPHRNSYPDAQYLHEVCTVLKKLGIA